jgi:hypothetical protein
MAFTPINLFEGTLVSNVNATYYTSPSQTRTIITKFTIENGSGLSVAITVNLVPKGGTASSSNQISGQLNILNGTVVDLYAAQGHILETGDTIQMIAATGNVLSARASGAQIT